MSTINYVCSEIKVICSNKEAYEKIAQIYKRKLHDYGNSVLVDNEFLVAMVDEIETNYMSDHAVDFLKNIIAYAQEVDPKAQFDGEITWQDEQYCTGEVHLVEQNGCYSVSKPVCRDREESVIHDASTETLIEELQRRGCAVSLTPLAKTD